MAPTKRGIGKVRKISAKRTLPIAGRRRDGSGSTSGTVRSTITEGGRRRKGHGRQRRFGSVVSQATPTTAAASLINRTVSTSCTEPHSPSTVTTDGSMVDANARRRTQMSVTQFVADSIFPHLKFLDGTQYTLQYSAQPKSICNLVLTRCLRTASMSQEWWEGTGKKYVRAAMSRLRSDRMQGVKQAFGGMFWLLLFVCLGFVITLSNLFFSDFLQDADDYLGGVSKFKLSQFLQGRKCPKVFRMVLERFVPGVIGRRLYKKRLKSCPKKDGALFTASDEAFMLLLLENSWNRWMDIYLSDPEKASAPRPLCLEPRKWRFLSDEPTLYTAGGIRYRKGKEGRSTNGWTPEGIQRYNELFHMVKRDRAERPGVFRKWIEELFDSNGTILGNQRESGVNLCNNATPIDSDLFSELGVGHEDDDSISGSTSGDQSGGPSDSDGDLCGSDDDDSVESVGSDTSDTSNDIE